MVCRVCDTNDEKNGCVWFGSPNNIIIIKINMFITMNVWLRIERILCKVRKNYPLYVILLQHFVKYNKILVQT